MRLRFVVAVAAAFSFGCVAAPGAPSPSTSAVVAGPAASGRGIWTADAGIYGTYNHFGNPPNAATYICGVGYNLGYTGGAPLVSVDVSVLFPAGLAAHVTPSSIATGWQRPTAQLSSPTDVHDAAWLSRVGGAVGGVCNNGPADLDSLRGTILKVAWTSVEGSYEQEFLVDSIRGEMTVFGMPDGRIRVCWAEPSRC